MKKKTEEIDLFKIHQESITITGTFWEEIYKGTVIHSILSGYKTEIIRNYTIVDIVFPDRKSDSTDTVLIKWAKRHTPLTDEELDEKWGRKNDEPYPE